MRKKCYRFFGALLTSQGNWLNKMSEKASGWSEPGNYFMNLNRVLLGSINIRLSLWLINQKKMLRTTLFF